LGGKGNDQISFDEAFSAVDKLLAFQRDNHTQIPLERLSPFGGHGSQTALLASGPGAACSENLKTGRTGPIELFIGVERSCYSGDPEQLCQEPSTALIVELTTTSSLYQVGNRKCVGRCEI